MDDVFRVPDLHGPRFRTKHKLVLVTPLFTSFIEKFPQYKGKIDYSLFCKIIGQHSTELRDTIANTRDGIDLHERLGHIFLGSYKYSTENNIDYAKSKECGKVVRHHNLETDGYVCKVFYSNWDRTKHNFRDREAWEFIPSKVLKSQCSEAFQRNFKLYRVVEHVFAIFRRAKAQKKQEREEKRTKIALETYNEFQLD